MDLVAAEPPLNFIFVVASNRMAVLNNMFNQGYVVYFFLVATFTTVSLEWIEKRNLGCFFNACHMLLFLMVDSQSVTAATVWLPVSLSLPVRRPSENLEEEVVHPDRQLPLLLRIHNSECCIMKLMFWSAQWLFAVGSVVFGMQGANVNISL